MRPPSCRETRLIVFRRGEVWRNASPVYRESFFQRKIYTRRENDLESVVRKRRSSLDRSAFLSIGKVFNNHSFNFKTINMRKTVYAITLIKYELILNARKHEKCLLLGPSELNARSLIRIRRSFILFLKS